MNHFEIDWTEPKGEHCVNWTRGEIDWDEPKNEHCVNW
jgi:hypothetical protein